MKRQEANRQILDIISQEVEDFKEGRFCQILQNLRVNTRMNDGGVIDNFHEESKDTLERVKRYKDSI